MKRLISFLALLAAVSLAPKSLVAHEGLFHCKCDAKITASVEVDGLSYDIYDDKTCTLTDISVELEGFLQLPESIKYQGENYPLKFMSWNPAVSDIPFWTDYSADLSYPDFDYDSPYKRKITGLSVPASMKFFDPLIFQDAPFIETMRIEDSKDSLKFTAYLRYLPLIKWVRIKNVYIGRPLLAYNGAYVPGIYFNSFFSHLSCIEHAELRDSPEFDYIPVDLFSGCRNLMQLDIPASVVELQYGCLSQTGIYYLRLHENVKRVYLGSIPEDCRCLVIEAKEPPLVLGLGEGELPTRSVHTLFVPAESVEAYRAMQDSWGRWANIKPIDENEIAALKAQIEAEMAAGKIYGK